MGDPTITLQRRLERLEDAFSRCQISWPRSEERLETVRLQLEEYFYRGDADCIGEAKEAANDIVDEPPPKGAVEANFKTVRQRARELTQSLHSLEAHLDDEDDGEFAPSPFPADTFDPSQIPQRRWVLGTSLQRGLAGALAAAPGTGKTAFQILSALSICTGYALTGEDVHESGPVWVINNEDPLEELDRRIAAACDWHGIPYSRLGGLYRNSGLSDSRFVVCRRSASGQLVATPKVDACIDHIKRNGIVALFVDPAVSTHDAKENDNGEIERVAELYRQVAHEGGCALEVAAHTVKTQSSDTEAIAGRMDALRGAGALVAAMRMVRTMCQMSEATAEKHRLTPAERRRCVRVDEAKANQSISDGEAAWYSFASVTIGNGESVGALQPYDLQSISEDRKRQAEREREEAEEPTRCSVAEVVCNAMPASGEMPVKDAAPLVGDALQVKERTARARINEAIPTAPAGRVVSTADGTWKLMLRAESERPKAPRTIVRHAVAVDASQVA